MASPLCLTTLPPPTTPFHPSSTLSPQARDAMMAAFEKVLAALRANDVSFLFRKPVTRLEAPDYHLYVKLPMDLSTMARKNSSGKYMSRDAFLSDMRLIRDNAYTYNEGRNPGIPELADKLLELCKAELHAHKHELGPAEKTLRSSLQ